MKATSGGPSIADRVMVMASPEQVAEAHERYTRVRQLLEADAPVADIARTFDLSRAATYNLIARTRRHFGARVGGTDLRPAGTRNSPSKYERTAEYNDAVGDAHGQDEQDTLPGLGA